MRITSIEDILPLVEKPSRYLGGEINQIKKDPAKVRLKFALAFPDLYEIGTSHFGMQILYHILNAHPEIAAERVFAPAADMDAHLRKAGLPLFSLESRRPLQQFDILGFSLLYELNYTNILTMLDLAKIPFYAAQRDLRFPMVIAGGPCACNPEPVADFFDAIVVGDGETVIAQLAESWIGWQKNPPADKEALLKSWSQIEGVYIPAFFEPRYDACGFQSLVPRYAHYTRVRRAMVANLDGVPFPEKPVVPFGKPVHDRLRLEVARGCTRGCRFCQAGMIYRPVRERSPDSLLALCDRSLQATGYEDVSLLSLSTGDYGCIVPLIQRLMLRYAAQNVAVSLPSLRVGTLTPQLMELIRTVRKTGFTIAPEAGSRRLREVINKKISDAEIIATVKDAFDLGWQIIKLYFMIGLPTETAEDLKALVDLVAALRKIKGRTGRRGQINVSVATFIPKPHTPFQWAGQLPLAEAQERIKLLQERLKLSGIQFKWQNPRASRLEGVWARGDRRLSRLLLASYHKGCRFDGWSDQFRYDLWQAAFTETGVDPDFYTVRKRDLCEPLPWDHIDTRVTKTFLAAEWENAFKGVHTADCRVDACNQCGVCDFEKIKPLTYAGSMETADSRSRPKIENQRIYKQLVIFYTKQRQARYLGHLELVNILLRALKRAGIPVKFSEGFHPKPKVSFDNPLPVGIESLRERFIVTVPADIHPRAVKDGLNAHLPDGIEITHCEHASSKNTEPASGLIHYRVALREDGFDKDRLKAFNALPELSIVQESRKGKLKKINLRAIVVGAELFDARNLALTLRCAPGGNLRPSEALRHVFHLNEAQVKQATIIKLGAYSMEHGARGMG